MITIFQYCKKMTVKILPREMIEENCIKKFGEFIIKKKLSMNLFVLIGQNMIQYEN